jgi:hypothetical protein
MERQKVLNIQAVGIPKFNVLLRYPVFWNDAASLGI